MLGVTCGHSDPNQHGFMDGLSLHHYTVPDTWSNKGSATDFDEKSWYRTLDKTLYMNTLIERHSDIMDRYDPDKKIGMVIDEWGTWYDCEPGTNPGFLYQQNTMRDALVAGINLNIFNKHCDRVKMANIAQLVNVLQSVILTDGDRMLKTPTYHVFKMYSCHQEAQLIQSSFEAEYIGAEDSCRVPNISESVSISDDGVVNITLANLSADSAYELETVLTDSSVKSVCGTIVNGGDIHAHNTFEAPDVVHTAPFTDFTANGGTISLRIPAASVLHLALTLS